ncbi:MAG: polysaccharide export protein [Symploca sp. SIO3E6]|nr:polysaccharide export protein [Caldora sp. SIO3E6]
MKFEHDMSNYLKNYLKINQSVVVTLMLSSVLTLPAVAEIPIFVEKEGSLSAESELANFQQEVFPLAESEFIDPSSNTFRKYLLGPGDRLEINVFGFEEFTGLLEVILPDGNITMPLIGSFKAAGKTPAQIQQELTRLLERDYLVDPVVTVALESLRPIVVNVAGEVERPGPVQLNSLTTNLGRNNQGNSDRRLPTVSAAVIAAGGATRRADISQVVLRRSLANGRSVTTAINFWESLRSPAAVEDLLLQDGDSIFVPQLAADTNLDPKLLARSTLAPETVRVRVAGEVKRPGEVEVTPESSLSSAVAIAGGPTVDADLGEVIFIRVNEEGIVEEQEVDLSSLTDDHQIQEGDVIYVPRSGRAERLDYAGRFSGPINALLNILRLFTPLPIGNNN